jgi:hypothetical protein
MGLFDRLFGKKANIALPKPDGSVRQATVTVRWLREMERLGKISPVGAQTVKVHILDPQAGLGQALGLPDAQLQELGMSTAVEIHRVEEWTIGKEISAEQYKKVHDLGTRDVYVMLVYDAGKPSTHFVRKDIWTHARKAMGA